MTAMPSRIGRAEDFFTLRSRPCGLLPTRKNAASRARTPMTSKIR
jgi:hypothetical protein